jgi:AcrR family transcriptional regulator
VARKRTLDTAAVVYAAAEIADAEGLDLLTLARVAERLDVRVPSLYNHVDGLPGLRRALALAGVRATIDAVRRATVGVSGDAAVQALARAYRAFAHAHPGQYAASVRAPDPDDTVLREASVELLDVVLAVLAPYHLDAVSATHAVRGFRSIVHGFVSLEAAGGFGMPLDVDESFDRLVRMLIAGLERGAGGAAPLSGSLGVTGAIGPHPLPPLP